MSWIYGMIFILIQISSKSTRRNQHVVSATPLLQGKRTLIHSLYSLYTHLIAPSLTYVYSYDWSFFLLLFESCYSNVLVLSIFETLRCFLLKRFFAISVESKTEKAKIVNIIDFVDRIFSIPSVKITANYKVKQVNDQANPLHAYTTLVQTTLVNPFRYC